MTRDDMRTIIGHYLRDPSAKSVLECEDIQAEPWEVYAFLTEAASFVEALIGVGSFDA